MHFTVIRSTDKLNERRDCMVHVLVTTLRYQSQRASLEAIELTGDVRYSTDAAVCISLASVLERGCLDGVCIDKHQNGWTIIRGKR